jgi:hypothetical protein
MSTPFDPGFAAPSADHRQKVIRRLIVLGSIAASLVVIATVVSVGAVFWLRHQAQAADHFADQPNVEKLVGGELTAALPGAKLVRCDVREFDETDGHAKRRECDWVGHEYYETLTISVILYQAQGFTSGTDQAGELFDGFSAGNDPKPVAGLGDKAFSYANGATPGCVFIRSNVEVRVSGYASHISTPDLQQRMVALAKAVNSRLS